MAAPGRARPHPAMTPEVIDPFPGRGHSGVHGLRGRALGSGTRTPDIHRPTPTEATGDGLARFAPLRQPALRAAGSGSQ